MSGESGNLAWLQSFYDGLTNGAWEEGYGCRIETLDNPGWMLRFDLKDTPLHSARLERIVVERSERDWLQYWVEDQVFQAACGPLNLDETLSAFRKWAEGAPGSAT